MSIAKTFTAANEEYVKDFSKRNLGSLALPPNKKVTYSYLLSGCDWSLTQCIADYWWAKPGNMYRFMPHLN